MWRIVEAHNKHMEALAKKRQERLDKKMKRINWLLKNLETADKHKKEAIKEILKFARQDWVDYWEIDEMIEAIIEH